MPAARLRAPRHRQDLPIITKSGPGVGPVAILLCLVTFPIGLALTLDGTTYDTWGAFIWGPALLVLAFPLCRWVANRTGEPEIAGFLFGAAVLKIIVGASVRYYMVDSVYGYGDSVRYDRVGGELAGSFRQGVFEDLGRISGTRLLEIVTGVVQAVIGQTIMGSFLVFAAFGFLGMCFFYLAFCELLPDGDRTLYRRLLFLTPTVWFWPSSIGKEAFIMMCMGAAAYGFSRLLTGHAGGLVIGGLGLWGAMALRPHIALMLMVGVLAALPALRPRIAEADRHRVGGWKRVALLLAVVLALPVVLSSVEELFGLDQFNIDTATEALEEVADRTAKGGSDFTPSDPANPLGYLRGTVTVVARPFLWEAQGGGVISALETTAIATISFVALLRRRRAALMAMRERWARFAAGYVLAYIWGFSVISNFGILARQRSLLLPLLFVLVAASTPTVRPVLVERDQVRPLAVRRRRPATSSPPGRPDPA
jgi:hypothetical protein